MRRAPTSRRTAFTLIELLMVIAIIGILVGLVVPAVMYAMTTVKQRAISMDVQTLANAVDQYKNKYGDYPPDGTDATIFTRHCRKLFPNMAPSELALVIAGSNCSTRPSGGVMDPPEALVFFLGGFSKDSVHPFTGTGGPFVATPTGSKSPYQYNVDRNEPLYEAFSGGQLTIDTFNDNGNEITVSVDETTFGKPTPSGFPGDLIPVYHPKGLQAPFVYFDSRTYSQAGMFFNHYDLGGYGVARPYKAGKGEGYDVNTKYAYVTGTSPAQIANNDNYYRYVNDRTYQIISAGLDDSYGGLPNPQSGPPLFFCYPNGVSLDITKPADQPKLTRYSENTGLTSTQLDNATNFAEGILSNELSN